MTAFCAELEPAFGLACKPVYLEDTPVHESESAVDGDYLRAALGDVDLVKSRPHSMVP